jgi:RimJ/RimL family protein N-acetyltransferase
MGACGHDEVTLRAVKDSDLDVFFVHQLDPDAVVMAAFPARDREAFDAHWAKCRVAEGTVLRTILYKGHVAGNAVSWDQDGQTKVGYWLGQDHWGKGIATVALTQFLQLLPMRPLYAQAAKHNKGSIRVLEKCGFTFLEDGMHTLASGEEVAEVTYVLK